jgi:hypothetical protein
LILFAIFVFHARSPNPTLDRDFVTTVLPQSASPGRIDVLVAIVIVATATVGASPVGPVRAMGDVIIAIMEENNPRRSSSFIAANPSRRCLSSAGLSRAR